MIVAIVGTLLVLASSAMAANFGFWEDGSIFGSTSRASSDPGVIDPRQYSTTDLGDGRSSGTVAETTDPTKAMSAEAKPRSGQSGNVDVNTEDESQDHTESTSPGTTSVDSSESSSADSPTTASPPASDSRDDADQRSPQDDDDDHDDDGNSDDDDDRSNGENNRGRGHGKGTDHSDGRHDDD